MPSLSLAPNLLAQDFKTTVTAPGQVWPSDIIYLWSREGWVHVYCMLHLFSHEIKGLSVDSHLRTSLITAALRMAGFRAVIAQKRGAKGLTLPSDERSS